MKTAKDIVKLCPVLDLGKDAQQHPNHLGTVKVQTRGLGAGKIRPWNALEKMLVCHFSPRREGATEAAKGSEKEVRL